MHNDTHYCRISITGLALALGVLWGVYLFVLALLAGWGVRFIWVSEELVRLFSAVYPGYAVGFAGAVIGLVQGFICGAVGGALLAWLHNVFCRVGK